jgi:hypothetical protein
VFGQVNTALDVEICIADRLHDAPFMSLHMALSMREGQAGRGQPSRGLN